MNEDLKPEIKPFRFKRPWETPPRDEEELSAPIPIAHHSVPTMPPILTTMKEEPKEEPAPNWSEEVEVFSFDREKLVLTSEKVRVKREGSSSSSPPIDVENNSSENNSNSKFPSSATSTSSASSSSGISFSSRGSNSDNSNSDSNSNSSSSSSDERRKRKNKRKRRKQLTLTEGLSIGARRGRGRPPKRKVDEQEEEEKASEESEGSSSEDSDDEEDESSLKLSGLVGRNKERKNSKWADYGVTRKSSRLRRTSSLSAARFCSKAAKAEILKKFTLLLKKDPLTLNEDDRESLTSFPELANEARKRLEKRHLAEERTKEEIDPDAVLEKKCKQLASVLEKARYLILYTGAGISTSASIPDYRGPNGVWTLMKKGQILSEDLKSFPQSADPTITHMALKELYERGIIKHIVSQNVDGLHLRSGIPKSALSEVHGNMYVEVCSECQREYVRLFDVTENTRLHHHKTGRNCYHCGTALKDSVVLFGEKGNLRWPINWAGAEYNVDKADVILCLGSSLKVLRRYPWLWCMSKPAKQRPKLYIVNLQWTPKDRFANLKINGRCDEVITKLMDNLNLPIPSYTREKDPIFSVATLLHQSELSTKLSKDLVLPEGVSYPAKSTDLRNYVRFDPVFCREVRALNQVKRKVVDGEKEEEEREGTKGKSVGNGGWLGNALSKTITKKKKVKQG